MATKMLESLFMLRGVQEIASRLPSNRTTTLGDGRKGTYTTAYYHFEQVTLSIPGPGRSLRSAASQGSGKRVDIQNCQTWLRAVVATLVQSGVMAEGAIQVVDNAPKN
ncbi:hypothetical protein BDU57DRAFT_372555 [Ampelomyces quisqualis]|uniref:Uncharacterized protein n=1 Tax=Ampelomyces quisqualis TaxID=50730 RepID=A0A6A5QAT1_AMPQU|nr:hypothetical protein BDU57DRAFT_372555 [Ampelomyces quisqualis]